MVPLELGFRLAVAIFVILAPTLIDRKSVV